MLNNGIVMYKNEDYPSLSQGAYRVTQIEITNCTITEEYKRSV